MTTSAPITERRYIAPLILVTTLFFLWVLGVNLNDVLIPHLKKVFDLNDFQSALIQVAFFGGYCFSALPAGRLLERIGYKNGIAVGLVTCAAGALLFIPAASIQMYGLFLFASFVMACGQGVLEVAANPYVTILGPSESSERRLNLAQSFNAVGAVVTPIIGGAFILSGIEHSAGQIAAMTRKQSMAYSALEASRVRGTYLAITALFLVVAVLLYFTRLPEIREGSGDAVQEREKPPRKHWEVWRYKHLVQGVIAQFFYVGAQVGVTSFVIRFTQHLLPGTAERVAANFLKWHLIGFMIGRFAGSALMKRIAPPRLLGFFAVCAFLCTWTAIAGSGVVSVWALVLLGFFDSIMFPTIFALSVKDLGVYTKVGSALLVMSIIGGALVPALMGYISDTSSIQKAFVVPLISYAYVIYFALRGYKPVVAP